MPRNAKKIDKSTIWEGTYLYKTNRIVAYDDVDIRVQEREGKFIIENVKDGFYKLISQKSIGQNELYIAMAVVYCNGDRELIQVSTEDDSSGTLLVTKMDKNKVLSAQITLTQPGIVNNRSSVRFGIATRED